FAQHPAGGRTVEIEPVAVPAVQGGNHKGLSFELKPHMSQECAVKNLKDRFRVVRSTLGKPAELSARCRFHGFGRVKVAIQFGSPVFPPSAEKACSRRNEVGVISEKMKRT